MHCDSVIFLLRTFTLFSTCYVSAHSYKQKHEKTKIMQQNTISITIGNTKNIPVDLKDIRHANVFKTGRVVSYTCCLADV